MVRVKVSFTWILEESSVKDCIVYDINFILKLYRSNYKYIIPYTRSIFDKINTKFNSKLAILSNW